MIPSRRGFLKALALVPLAAAPFTVHGHEGQVREVDKDGGKRYVFVFPNVGSQAEVEAIKHELERRGYKDALVVGGKAAEDFQMFLIPE